MKEKIIDLGKLPNGIPYELYLKMWEQSLRDWVIRTGERSIKLLIKGKKNVNKNKSEIS